MCYRDVLQDILIGFESAWMLFTTFNGDIMKVIKEDWIQLEKLCDQASGHSVKGSLTRVASLAVEVDHLRVGHCQFEFINDGIEKHGFALSIATELANCRKVSVRAYLHREFHRART